jgi:type I restriction enzyme S subunit
MEVKPGYKNTSLGIIPDDWTVDFVENIASISTGNKNTKDRIEDGAYPFFVRSQTVERINSYSYDGEAVLTAGDGVGTGKVFHYIRGKFDVHQRVYRIADFSKQIDGFFFFLYFSQNFYDRIMQMTAKSSVDSVRRDMIARMPIPIPSTKAEQDAIVSVLRDVDALVHSLEQLITKMRDIKQGAMHDLLTGEKRLPGYNGAWIKKMLSENAIIAKGQQLDAHQLNPEGIFAHLNGGINPSGYTDKSNMPGNTIVISEGGNSCGYVQYIKDPFWCGGHCYSLLPKDVDNRFLYQALKREQPNIMALRVGSGLPNVQKTALLAFKIRFPSDKMEQAAIGALLSDMDEGIDALDKELSKVRLLRLGMMRSLLTGRIRLE